MRAFVEVARQQSFTRAAEKLTITQPALTRAIKQLETALRVRLFNRSSRHVELTNVGHSFLAQVERVLNELDRAMNALGEQVSTRHRAAAGDTSGDGHRQRVHLAAPAVRAGRHGSPAAAEPVPGAAGQLPGRRAVALAAARWGGRGGELALGVRRCRRSGRAARAGTPTRRCPAGRRPRACARW
nr:LysR family transcriptional regulator [Streptomyces sp. CT34]